MKKKPLTPQIFDKTFKRMFALSDLAIINLINGMFNKDHPTDSEVIMLRNEFVNRALDKRSADVLLQIAGCLYHLEAEIQGEEDIVLRVFEYGFLQAMQMHSDGKSELVFPEPMVIYLNGSDKIPETSTLVLRFGSQGTFSYQVKNFMLLKHDVQELNRKKMVLLLPFYLLKLREGFINFSGETDLDALRHLVRHDILDSIEANLKFGNISQDDYDELLRLTGGLCEYLYSDHFEKVGEDMGRLFPDALILPGDDLRYEIQELKDALELRDKAIAERDEVIAERDEVIAERDKAIAEQDVKLAQMQETIAQLQAAMAQLKK